MRDALAIVFIRDNDTGEVRCRGDTFDLSEDGDYLWSEGNYACDCNRAQLFAWASGIEDDPNRECGMERYSLRIVAAEDGRELYEDGDWDTATPLI